MSETNGLPSYVKIGGVSVSVDLVMKHTTDIERFLRELPIVDQLRFPAGITPSQISASIDENAGKEEQVQTTVQERTAMLEELASLNPQRAAYFRSLI